MPTANFDLESTLREHFKESPVKTIDVQLWTNNEGRIIAQLLGREFTVFGNNTIPYEPPPEKPITQRVAIPGLDSFKPMGSR